MGIDGFCFFLDYFESEKNYKDTTVEMAWNEIAYIEKEQEKYAELRTSTERELENCKKKAAALERVS